MNSDDFLRTDAAPGIDPALRILLTSDGSITLLLQSLLLSPIEVEILRQEETELDHAAAERLEAEPGVTALFRDVWLTAKGRRLVNASSVILLDGMAPPILAELRGNRKPLGLLLQESGQLVSRDRLQIAPDTDPIIHAVSEYRINRSTWMRRYRMCLSSRPVALIHERFDPDLTLS